MPFTSNLRALNLNYLPILREVLRQRSVSKAAAKLHLTQPAVSNTLRVLREHFDDDLLTRSGKDFVLTAKGEQLQQSLELALHHVETVVDGETFDLQSATGTVRIATADYVIGNVAIAMSGFCAQEAPNLQTELLVATRNLADDLQSGGIDIGLTSTVMMDMLPIGESVRRQLRSEVLGDERLVCIGAKDDAALAAGLSVEDYFARTHVSYIVDSEQHQTVERQWLGEKALSQNIRFRTASNLSLPEIVATTGCLSLVPESLALKAVTQFPIQVVKAPMPLPDIRWVLVWHQRSEADPIINWAIQTLTRCCKEVLSRGSKH